MLRVLVANDWARAPAVVDAVRSFERSHPRVRVNLDSVYFEDMADTARAAIDAGRPHDVVQWHAFAAGAQGLAQPLDDLWLQRLSEDEFLAGSVEDVVWAGRHYGVPLDTNAMLVLYDAERFAAAGVAEPGPTGTMSLAQLEAAARALTTPDGTRRAIGLASSTWHTYGWIAANGGEVVEVNADGSPRFTLDAPPVVEAVEYLVGLIKSGVAVPPAGVSGDRIDAFELLRSGATAMHVSGSWDLPPLRSSAAASRYRVAQMPRGSPAANGGTAMGGSSLFVPKGSTNRALAFEFMLHLTTDRAALRLARDEGRLPVRLRVYEDPFFQTPELRTFLEQLKTAHPFKLEAFPAAHAAFADAVEGALAGHKDTQLALSDAQRRAEMAERVNR